MRLNVLFAAAVAAALSVPAFADSSIAKTDALSPQAHDALRAAVAKNGQLDAFDMPNPIDELRKRAAIHATAIDPTLSPLPIQINRYVQEDGKITQVSSQTLSLRPHESSITNDTHDMAYVAEVATEADAKDPKGTPPKRVMRVRNLSVGDQFGAIFDNLSGSRVTLDIAYNNRQLQSLSTVTVDAKNDLFVQTPSVSVASGNDTVSFKLDQREPQVAEASYTDNKKHIEWTVIGLPSDFANYTPKAPSFDTVGSL
jgi:hypothetical protein